MGATTAWDAVRRAPFGYVTRETATGEPTQISRRGRTSIAGRQSPLVVIDGIPGSDFRVLRQIPASNVARITLLSSAQATLNFGVAGGSGALLVETVGASSQTPVPGADAVTTFGGEPPARR